MKRVALLKDKFKLKYPMIVAPMAGPTTPAFVAAASNAGVMGSLAGAYMKPEAIRDEIRKVRSLTSHPFAVNLFAPAPDVGNGVVERLMSTALKDNSSYRQELKIPEPKIVAPFTESFDKQFQVVLDEKPAIFSFVFGLLDSACIKECRARGIYTIGAATCVEEAQALEALGVDALVAQGYEAGGHRAIFTAEAPDPMIGTIDLVQQVCREVRIPVIASGGLMSGADISRALASGASAVQLGTAFLLSKEAGTAAAYRRALAAADGPPTKTTRVFSGRLARGLQNRYMTEMESGGGARTVLPFPVQNAFTRDLRTAAAAQGNSDFLSLWAGSGIETHRGLPWQLGSVESIVRRLAEEARL